MHGIGQTVRARRAGGGDDPLAERLGPLGDFLAEMAVAQDAQGILGSDHRHCRIGLAQDGGLWLAGIAGLPFREADRLLDCLFNAPGMGDRLNAEQQHIDLSHNLAPACIAWRKYRDPGA